MVTWACCVQAYDLLHTTRTPHDWWYRPASAKKKPAKRARAAPAGPADADAQAAAALNGAAGYAVPSKALEYLVKHAALPNSPLLVCMTCSVACGVRLVPDLAQRAQGWGGRKGRSTAGAAGGAARRRRGRG